MHEIYIHTIESLKYSFIVEMFFELNEPIMLIGQSGLGKTKIIRNKIDSLV